MDPDPFTAIQNALQFYAVDEIVISTFPPPARAGCAGDLVGRVQASTSKPVEHVVVKPSEAEEGASGPMEPLGHDAHDHHGPPPANQSSRVEPQILGMLLFIISEVMLFERSSRRTSSSAS